MADKKKNILSVKNKKLLSALPNIKNGEVVFCEKEQVYMIYKNHSWKQTEPTFNDVNLNLYDINKMLIQQMSPLTEEQLAEKEQMLNDWHKINLYMLYGQEISYFTLFSPQEESPMYNSFGESVIKNLQELSEKIYSIDLIEDSNVIEIWIKYKEQATVLYLFNYEDGVITYG